MMFQLVTMCRMPNCHVSEPEVVHEPEYVVQSTDNPEITFKMNLNPLVSEFMPSSATDVVSWQKQRQMQNAQLTQAIKLLIAQLTPFESWPFI